MDPRPNACATVQNLSYTVQVDGQDKKLLDAVSGVVRPGKLCALMGASGAGKTTLLDNLSRRKTTGRIEGDLLIDGKPLDSAFSRRTGFVQQGDIHEPMSTVRECLEVIRDRLVTLAPIASTSSPCYSS